MKILPPLEISGAMLISSTVPEPDASVGEVLWNAATSYTLATRVVRSTTHRIYQNAIAGVDATFPENAPARWQDVGPTNRYAAFDQNRSTPCIGASPLTVVVQPNIRFDSAGIFRLVADSATITVTSGGVNTFSETIALLTRNTTSWYTWLTGRFIQRQSVVRLALLPNTDNIITINLTKSSGMCRLGECVLGFAEYVGDAQFQARDDAINFSKVTRGLNGELSIEARRNVPTNKLRLITPKNIINNVRELRDLLNAKPAVFIGTEDDTSAYFEAVLKLGLARVWGHGIDYPTHFQIDMEIEEL